MGVLYLRSNVSNWSLARVTVDKAMIGNEDIRWRWMEQALANQTAMLTFPRIRVDGRSSFFSEFELGLVEYSIAKACLRKQAALLEVSQRRGAFWREFIKLCCN